MKRICYLLGLEYMRHTRLSYSVSEAKEKKLIFSREEMLDHSAQLDLLTGLGVDLRYPVYDSNAYNEYLVLYFGKTYRQVIEGSEDPERYMKLFNKIYNNVFASTGKYNLDMFIYERDIVFKSRKRIQVASTFPLQPNQSYPGRVSAMTVATASLKGVYPNKQKQDIFEYIFRRMFKSKSIGSSN
jgi:hypothetical protein